MAAPTAWEANVREDLREPRFNAEYAQLVAAWQEARRQHHAQVLLCGSLSGGSAAEVVMRGAMQLAERSGDDVLVVDADPSAWLTQQMALGGRAGLAELLDPADAHGEVIQPTSAARLHVVGHGQKPWPAEVTPERVRELLGDFARDYAWVLLAAAGPDHPVVQRLASACGGTYVIAPPGKLEANSARQQLALWRTAGARVLGCIIAPVR